MLFHLCRKCGSKSYKQTSFFRVSIRVMYKWDDDMMNFSALIDPRRGRVRRLEERIYF